MKKLLITASALMIGGVVQSQIPQTQRYELNLIQTESQPYENTIQVTGTSEREVVPDEIYVRIIISENDTKGKTTVDQMEQDMIRVLLAAGIDVEENLKVGDMSAEMYTKTFGRRTARTTAIYQLKVGSASQLAQVYQDLGNAEIYNLGVIRVAHSNIRGINDELRVEALRNAQQIARTMAQALGQDIGKAIYIVDHNTVQPVYSRAVAEYSVMDTAAGAPAPVELDFRNIKLNYSVTVKFALQ